MSKFWIATCLDSTYTYSTKEDAIGASKELAEANPNKPFYVLESCGFSVTSSKAEFHASEEKKPNNPLAVESTATEHDVVREEIRAQCSDQLRRACVMGDIAQVTRILSTGFVDVNEKDKDGRTVLMSACWNGRGEVVKYLISQGADVNVKDNGGLTVWDYATSSPFCSSSEIDELKRM